MSIVKARVTVNLMVPAGEERAAAWMLRDILEHEVESWENQLAESVRQLQDEEKHDPDHPRHDYKLKPFDYSVPLARGKRVEW